MSIALATFEPFSSARVAPILLSLVCSLLALPARAEGDASSRAQAVQLFDEAEALFARGEVGKACPKYAESYRLDPQLGALIYLADCYEKNGQVASAWGSFREAEELAKKRQDPRGEHAQERAAALEPQLSYLVIEVPVSMRVPGLQVLRDGAPVVEVVWGSRSAIDAGPHRIEARATGYLPWQQSVVVAKGPGAQHVSVPPLRPDNSALAAKKTMTAGGARRVAALAVGGLGIVGVGVGGFFGLSAQSTLSDSVSQCNDQNFCTDRGVALRKSAGNKALVATVASGLGAGALVAAAVLWFTAPRPEVESVGRGAAQQAAWRLAPQRDAWGLEVSRAF